MEIYTGKVFQSGGSQAVRMPKGCSFEKDIKEVYIIEQANGKKIIMPKKKSLIDFYQQYNHVESDKNFLIDREDAPPQDRELF